MYYVKEKEIEGRLPYVLFNKLEEMWKGARGEYFLLTDTWVYPSEKYRLEVKLRPLHPAKLMVRVLHSDGVEEVFKAKIMLPLEFYEESFTTSSGGVEGEELCSIILSPITQVEKAILPPEESFTVNVPVISTPVQIVVRRQGAVGGRVDATTQTLPAVRKIMDLGVLGDYGGYERELRSIFAIFRLYFGSRLSRNIILKKGHEPSRINYDGDLYLNGILDKLIPLGTQFTSYFRSHITFKHEVLAVGGERRQTPQHFSAGECQIGAKSNLLQEGK